MKICFGLAGVGTAQLKKFFRSESLPLFETYQKRIGEFSSVSAAGLKEAFQKAPGDCVWLCDLSAKARPLSSEDLAVKLNRLQTGGTRCWWIIIGPADGFTDNDRAGFKPDFLWSFGPQTLPHDLAAIVAAEQVYRAFTILRNHPYHQKH